jgi:hypothetical protein
MVPVAHVRGREVKVFAAFNSSIQPPAPGFCQNLMEPPVPSNTNQYLLPGTILTGATGTVFHAAFWNVVELPPVRRVPGCPSLSLHRPTNKFVAVVAAST